MSAEHTEQVLQRTNDGTCHFIQEADSTDLKVRSRERASITAAPIRTAEEQPLTARHQHHHRSHHPRHHHLHRNHLHHLIIRTEELAAG